MKKFFGLCALLAFITGGVVLSDEVKSIVEQNAVSDAAQAVESAVNDSINQPIQEALPEQEVLPEQSDNSIPANEEEAEIVQTPQPAETSPSPQPDAKTPYIWGVITSPIPPMVRAQVNLPEESGLFVQTIKPNGPAAKAGVLPYDIIVSVDGVAISNTNVLAAEIQKAAGKSQKLTLLRYGKELTVDIVAQPAEAPRHPYGFLPGTSAPVPQIIVDPMAPNYDPNDDDDDDSFDPAFPRIQSFMERQRRQMENMRQRMEAMENAMRQGMPGFVPFAPGSVPGPFQAPAPAPAQNGALTLPPGPANAPNAQVQSDSFSVQVQKNGNEPAIIKIQENGNEYIVDENSIDQLPENVKKRLNFKIQTNDK